MAQAPTALTTLGFVSEATYGTTPTTPAFLELPRTDFTLNPTFDELTDDTISATRQDTAARRGNGSVEGDLVVNLRPDVYDPFLEMFMGSTFSSNVLLVGNALGSVSIERGIVFPDPTTPVSRYQVFRGVCVNTFALEATTDAFISATFGLFGATATDLSGTASLDASGYTAAAVKPLFFHEGGTIQEGGSTVGFISAIKFTGTNNISGSRAYGTTGYRGVTTGKFEVTGTLTALLESDTLYNKLIGNTTSSIKCTMVAGAESYEFFFPDVRYTSGSISTPNNAGVTAELNWRAIYHVGTLSAMKITRV
jgi:hypothetical protein